MSKKLFISVSEIYYILTPMQNKLYKFMLSNLTLLFEPNCAMISSVWKFLNAIVKQFSFSKLTQKAPFQ